jgi:hypothetical protein
MSLNTKIPGLSIEFTKIGSNLWTKVCHEGSEFFVLKFDKSPLPFGKREFIKRLDASCLTSVDWTQAPDVLATKEIFDIVCKAKLEILA